MLFSRCSCCTRQQEQTKESCRSQERSLQELQAGQLRGKLMLTQKENTRQDYEKELNARRTVLRYLELEETALFDTEKILHASERKLLEIAGLRRNLEKEEDSLQKEYQRLTQGKVLELPDELERELKELGIHAVYGMEWLGKNGYSEEQNLELVHRHPFLPYALILSEAELKKLSRNTEGIYTSFPIPIVPREMLESEEGGRESGIIRLDGVSFYVLFNENLLNEEKLRLLVEEKEREIRKKKEAIEVRQTEYTEYFERQEMIRNQEVSKEKWDANEKDIRELTEQTGKLERDIRECLDGLGKLRSELEHVELDIRRTGQETERQQRRIEDFARLCKEYELYEQNLNELERCKREAEKLTRKQKLSKERQEKLRERQKSGEIERNNLVHAGEELKKEIRKYQRYNGNSDDTASTLDDSAVREMEARYAAVTSQMSQEIQELEEQEQRAAGRYQDAADELLHLQRKYGFAKEEWAHVSYSREEESHQEIMLEDRKQKIAVKQRLWNEEDKQIAVVEQQKRERLAAA